MRNLFYKKFAREVKIMPGGDRVPSGEGVGEWASDPSRRRTSRANQNFLNDTPHIKKINNSYM